MEKHQGAGMYAILVPFLISFGAYATSWEDLEVGKNYKISQSFQLQQVGRSGSYLDFIKGEKVGFKEALPISIPGASLMLYRFNYKNCPGPQMTTDLELVSVQGTHPVVQAGAQLDKNCELNVYIETKDYYQNSLFE